MLTNQSTLRLPRAAHSLCRLTAIATLAMGAAMASHAAGGGEALDIELPSMRTPVEAERGAITAAPTVFQAEVSADAAQPLTRARVRESLAMARLANLVNPGGEMGDTAEVLQAREDFNALQTEVMEAEYRSAALRLQQAQVEALLLQAMGAAAPAATQSSDGTPAADQPIVEVVVVSSNKAYELLMEAGQAGADTTTPDAPAVILLLVNDSKSD